jgi:DNA-binding transcriptional regulator PaaX
VVDVTPAEALLKIAQQLRDDPRAHFDWAAVGLSPATLSKLVVAGHLRVVRREGSRSIYQLTDVGLQAAQA